MSTKTAIDPRSEHDMLQAEQEFFDREAAALTDEKLRTPQDQMDRYLHAKLRSTNIPKETLFALMGSLKGKRILEYGCGFGEDTVHLAYAGAEVTSFDISPVSVAKARRRAELLGLADKVTLEVKHAGQLGYPKGYFDVVYGSAILHHLHTQLDMVYGEIASFLKPGGQAYFIEPVANSRFLQAIRTATPVERHATPDERQLYYSDFELMKKHGFSRVDYHHFYCLARLTRITGGHFSSMYRRLDHYAQRILPPLKRFYGTVAIVAHRA